MEGGVEVHVPTDKSSEDQAQPCEEEEEEGGGSGGGGGGGKEELAPSGGGNSRCERNQAPIAKDQKKVGRASDIVVDTSNNRINPRVDNVAHHKTSSAAILRSPSTTSGVGSRTPLLTTSSSSSSSVGGGGGAGGSPQATPSTLTPGTSGSSLAPSPRRPKKEDGWKEVGRRLVSMN